jgi:hypothetical protein
MTRTEFVPDDFPEAVMQIVTIFGLSHMAAWHFRKAGPTRRAHRRYANGRRS